MLVSPVNGFLSPRELRGCHCVFWMWKVFLVCRELGYVCFRGDNCRIYTIACWSPLLVFHFVCTRPFQSMCMFPFQLQKYPAVLLNSCRFQRASLRNKASFYRGYEADQQRFRSNCFRKTTCCC